MISREEGRRGGARSSFIGHLSSGRAGSGPGPDAGRDAAHEPWYEGLAMPTAYGEYEAVIGLEVHAQLLTRTKLFCACATSFGDPPNTHTCPVCLGLPGSLPVLNREAVRMAMSAALALGCSVAPRSVFARKNYFYPDLPKGYQISQYELPLASRGVLEIEVEGVKRRAGILRVHMEEDAGKNMHGLGDDSIVDLNRAGTPLIEIVGDPDLRSGAEAAEYLKRLREILMFAGVNDGNLEQGSFRCDANVSVRKVGVEKLGTRTELKNINSFRFVADAIDIEIRRQITLIEGGDRVRQQTRGYNAEKRETYLLRDKENESGYRYFPEPDLPPLDVDTGFVAEVRATLPEGPAQRRRRMVDALGLTPYAASVLTGHPQIAAFFQRTAALYPEAVKASNFIQSEVLRDVTTAGLEATFPITPAQVADLLRLVDEGTISGKQAKEVYAAMKGTPIMPATIVRDRGMTVISDEGSLEALARKLAQANEKQAAAYRAGKTNLLGFFVGQMMKQTGGSADPAVVNKVLKRVLAEEARPANAGPESGTLGPIQTSATTSGVRAAPDAPSFDKAAETQPRPDGTRAQAMSEAAPGSTPKTGAPSPLAQSVAPGPDSAPLTPEHTTLTSASGVPAVQLPLPPPTPNETIAYDDFARVDLRVGVVISAERVPRKDKLLDLRVDLGEPSGPRRIVAGLALSFTPEALTGRRVIVAANLAPRDFGKGLVSYGMILAAGPSESLSLATVSSDVPPGTRLK
ncbi:Aspartyl-tRNA(Asn) amidotransferase subunit B [Minicystis rosea]|nr:Aspartyl-tRNA(Asn) amidotransferase subunit B [Minicystis rosea]